VHRECLGAVGVVEPPVLKGRNSLQDGLLPNIRVGYGALAPCLFLHVHLGCSMDDDQRTRTRVTYLLMCGFIAQEHGHLCSCDGEGWDCGPTRDGTHLLCLIALPPPLVPVDMPPVHVRS